MRHLKKCFSSLAAILFIGQIISGCQLKKRDVETGKEPIVLPPGPSSTVTRASKNHKFIVRSSTEGLSVRSDNKIAYSIVTGDLLVPSGELSVEASYRIPDLPSAGEFKATAVSDGPGKYSIGYNIPAAGLWEIKLVFVEKGSVVDEMLYTYPISELPKEVKPTKNGKYFVRASVDTLKSGEENKITYTVVGDNLEMPAAGLSVEAIYWMPDMPEMGKFNASGTSSAPGKFALTYEISMPGLWEITLKFYENGSQVDEVVYSYNVET
ncbi:MAG: FixH family protein [Deltaproteobacteria bacterium]|nr:FixH family protein [Deltaproteobacteria bacterium]